MMRTTLTALVLGLSVALSSPTAGQPFQQEMSRLPLVIRGACVSYPQLQKIPAGAEREQALEALSAGAREMLISSYDHDLFKMLTGHRFDENMIFYIRGSLMEEEGDAYFCARAAVPYFYVRLIEIFNRVGQN